MSGSGPEVDLHAPRGRASTSGSPIRQSSVRGTCPSGTQTQILPAPLGAIPRQRSGRWVAQRSSGNRRKSPCPSRMRSLLAGEHVFHRHNVSPAFVRKRLMCALIDMFGAKRLPVTGRRMIFSGNTQPRFGSAACKRFRPRTWAVHDTSSPFRHAKGRAGCRLSLKRQYRDRVTEIAYQRKSFGPSFQPARVHKAIVPPYHSAMKGTESSAQ
jgi:hypothetical protein